MRLQNEFDMKKPADRSKEKQAQKLRFMAYRGMLMPEKDEERETIVIDPEEYYAEQN